MVRGVGYANLGAATMKPTAWEPRRIGERSFVLDVDDGWQQGRGAFGGLVMGAQLKAMEACAGDGRVLRSLTAELPSPTLPGAAELHVELLRAGSNQSTMAARLVQQGEVKAHSVAVFGKPRENVGDDFVAIEPPVIRPYDETPMWPTGESGPSFAQFYEYRFDSPMPFSSNPEASAQGWIRYRPDRQSADIAWLVGMADAWWPSIFVRLPAPRPMATISFMMQPASAFGSVRPGEPLIHRAKTLSLHEGWIIEHRELWSSELGLVAIAQESFVIIK